jgi:hypothetical protein
MCRTTTVEKNPCGEEEQLESCDESTSAASSRRGSEFGYRLLLLSTRTSCTLPTRKDALTSPVSSRHYHCCCYYYNHSHVPIPVSHFHNCIGYYSLYGFTMDCHGGSRSECLEFFRFVHHIPQQSPAWVVTRRSIQST